MSTKDGGGVSGLSSLVILQELMKRVQTQLGLPDVPRPCEMFDLIAGTGTGGIIAVLLGRLELRVENAIEAYQDIIREGFSESKYLSGETYKATNMENAIKRVVERYTGQVNTMMINSGRCQTFVCAMQAENMTAGIPTPIRTYTVPENDGPKCTIVQALRATTAMMGYFKPVIIDHSGAQTTYVDGGVGTNNPTVHMLDEAGRIFLDQSVSCVISIGAGHLHPIGIRSRDLGARIAKDTERVAQEMARRFQNTTDMYSRFNVEQGLQDIGPTDWEKMPEVVMHSRQYMRMFEVDKRLTQTAKALVKAEVSVPATLLSGIIPATEAVKTFRDCPLPSPAFVGQKDALTQMENSFWDGVEGRHVFVLYGLGGGGKTQLALKFAQIHRNKFSEAFCIDATSVNTIESDLASLAAAKKLGKHYVIAIKWLASRQERWLLILNNADDTSLDLKRYFPPCSHGDVLITTRNRQLINYTQGPKAHRQLAQMGLEDGKRLLLRTSQVAEDEANDKVAEAIVNELGSLALAIAQAGAYICVHQCSLDSYLDMYRTYRGELLEQYKHLTPKLDDYKWTVFTTWKVSLRKLSPQAIELFRLLAFMHHDRILEDTFRRACLKVGLDKRVAFTDEYASAEGAVASFLSAFQTPSGDWYRPAFLQLITEIRSYSLIDFDPSHGTYSVHSLVHSWIRTTVEESSEAEKRTTILLALSIDREFEAHDYEYRIKLVPHIDALPTAYTSDPNLARKFAMVYDEAGKFQVAKSLFEAVVETDKRIFGPCHPDTLTDMFELANAYHRNGEPREAENMYTAVIEGRTQALGAGHPDTYRAKGYLAATHRQQSRFKEAVQLNLEVIEAAKRLLGPEARETFISRYSLAATYFAQGRFQDAESILTELISTETELLGSTHPDTLNAMELLADVLQSMSGYEGLDRLGAAEDIATRVLETRRQTYGDDHPRTLACHAIVARIHFKQGRFDSAVKIQEETDNIQSQTLGELHARTRSIRKDLAFTYQSLGRFAEAETVQRKVVEVGIRVLGRENPDVLSTIINLAKVCSLRGKWTEAETIIAEELDVWSRMSDTNDGSAVTMLKVNMADLYVKQRRWEEAKVLMQGATQAILNDPEHRYMEFNLQTLNKIEEALWKERCTRWVYYLAGFFVALLSITFMHTRVL
ncbi:nephrocystin-3 protein [Rhizoctonia solani AG-3 Rhs1AP]|uniref:Nephrocystin-3 protein n=1 Tax=Rhizoctonia solani AG-3 Rhs1AP TaxID=1086054 RepID=X8JUW4_9AGAM|nr:nephrocystin-3 protein [Rhizoctonia solani AG-3 Rhs1AP]